MVNGLLKTAQGVPNGAETSLNPVQDAALKLAAIKCLVGVLRSMGNWLNRQLRLTDSSPYIKSNDGEENTSEAGDTASAPALGSETGEESVLRMEMLAVLLKVVRLKRHQKQPPLSNDVHIS